MQLLQVISSVNPAGGGPIEGVIQIIRVLAKHGHTVDVASSDAPTSPWLVNLPFRHFALGPAALSYGYNSGLVPWLRKNARNYDAIVVNGLWEYHSFAVWRALHKTNIPYFVFTHGMLDPWFKRTYPLKHLKKWLYWPWAEYRVLRDAASVLFTCEEERRLARQSFWLYRCKEVVAGFGTSAPTGDPQVQREQFLSAFPHLQGKRLFLFLSRIHEKKGCDILIQAFSRFTARDPSIHLVIAGPDQTGWQHYLVELGEKLGISERITYPGMLTGDMKWGAYRAADVFVLPSHQENFGIVVAEAAACGVPVLISDKVNIWREIDASGAAIVTSDDLAGTVMAIDSWLAMSAEQRDTMRINAVKAFRSHFDVETSALRLADIIQKSLQPHS